MILGIRAVLELSETSGGLDKNDGFLLPNGKPSVHVDRCRNCIAFVSGRAMLRVMKCWILALTGAALLAVITADRSLVAAPPLVNGTGYI